jgi:hypothetical protein
MTTMPKLLLAIALVLSACGAGSTLLSAGSVSPQFGRMDAVIGAVAAVRGTVTDVSTATQFDENGATIDYENNNVTVALDGGTPPLVLPYGDEFPEAVERLMKDTEDGTISLVYDTVAEFEQGATYEFFLGMWDDGFSTMFAVHSESGAAVSGLDTPETNAALERIGVGTGAGDAREVLVQFARDGYVSRDTDRPQGLYAQALGLDEPGAAEGPSADQDAVGFLPLFEDELALADPARDYVHTDLILRGASTDAAYALVTVDGEMFGWFAGSDGVVIMSGFLPAEGSAELLSVPVEQIDEWPTKSRSILVAVVEQADAGQLSWAVSGEALQVLPDRATTVAGRKVTGSLFLELSGLVGEVEARPHTAETFAALEDDIAVPMQRSDEP